MAKKETVMISANLDAQTKKEAEKIFDRLGISMTSAINLYLKAVVKANGIPFPLTAKPEDLQRFKRLSKYHYELNVVQDHASEENE